MKRLLDLSLFFGTVAILYVGMAWLSGQDFGPTVTVFHPKSLATAGFILLAAFTMGEFFKLFNIPALLGYIVAGVLFGPNLGPMLPFEFPTLFSASVIADLALVNVLTVGVIGTMGGGELKIEDVKQNFTTIVTVFGILGAIAFSGTWVAVMMLYQFAPEMLPFLEGLPVEHVYGAALLFSVFSLAMSPAATLAILQETRASGRMSSLVLGMVVIADLLLVGGVLIAREIVSIMISPEGFTMAALAAELPKIGAEFGGALIIGVGMGLLFIGYLRWIRRELLFFTVAIIFAGSYVAQLFHAETLLAFLTAGFIVQNFSRHGHDMIHALEKISLPVFVIYFMAQATILDLEAVSAAIGLTLILTAIRAVAHFLGAKIGTHLVGADPVIRKYLWITFFSLAGVDLVLAGFIAEAIQPWGEDFRTVIMSVVVIHIIAGPPLLKLALDWAGETEGSRQQSREEAEAFDQLPAVGEITSLSASFPIPNFQDDALNARVTRLRELVVDLHRTMIVEPLEDKTDALHASMRNAAEELDAALEDVAAILQSDAYDSEAARAVAIAERHVQYLADIEDNVETYERINPEIVSRERLFELLDTIRGTEPFESLYRVDIEDFLHQIADDDPALTRVVKAMRRMRRAIFGRGTRQVPLGRLWRYYVELTVPRMLSRAAGATAVLNERLWADLGNHMRRADDLFDEVFDAVLARRDAEASEGAEDEAAHEPVADPLELLQAGRVAANERSRALDEQLAETASSALDRYTVALRETFANFLAATAKAGTSQLPTWRYRPSAQFDRARRSEAAIEARLEREQTIVTGQRGWIVAEYQLVLFLYWLETYEVRVRETLQAMTSNPVTAQLDVLRAVTTSLPPQLDDFEDLDALREVIEGPQGAEHAWPAVRWDQWLEEEIRPAIARTRNNMQRMLGLYAQGHAARRLLEILERRVAEFSDEIILMSVHPDLLGPADVVPTLNIPLREWFVSEVVRETALRLVEFDERGEAFIRRSLETLEDIEQVLEFNLLTADRDSDDGEPVSATDLATGGLERAARMITELRDEQVGGFGALTNWIVRETSLIAERAAEPFLQHRPAEIERLMGRRGQTSLAERGENWLSSIVNRGVAAARGTYRRYAPVAGEVVEELGALFVEEEQAVPNADIRRRLHPDERRRSTIPAIYRRLFTPLPLDIADFYIPRPELERRCARVVREWADGRPHALLLHGDRGMGKRSVVHNIFQNDPEILRALEHVAIHTVVLDEDVQSEADLVARIASALVPSTPETLDRLVRVLELVEGRHVIVLENGEKLFQRTPQGLAACRRFLRNMNDTSDRFLWIVLMGTSAATMLQTAIGLFDHFTAVEEVGPLDAEALEQMIQRRHRVSGFRASFERDRPRIRDWIRHPLATSDALRDPREEFFRELWRISEGNPMRALLYWLESVSLDDADDHLIWVRATRRRELPVVESLSLMKRLILAALIQHHTMTAMQLRAVLRCDFESVETELAHLVRLGFLRVNTGRHAVAYELRPLAAGIVTSELRNRNMI